MSGIPVSYLREGQKIGLLWLPLIVVVLIAQIGMSAIDMAMVGNFVEADGPGLGLAQAVHWPLMLLLTGALLAVTPTVGQLYGADRADEAGAVARQALWFGAALAIVAIIVLWSAGTFFRQMNVDAALIPTAEAYLKWLSIGVVGFLGFTVLRNLCDGMSLPLVSMIVLLCAFVVKLPLTWVFVNVMEMGVAGCGLATALTMWCQLLFVVIAIKVSRINQSRVFEQFDPPHWGKLSRLVKYGLPMGGTAFVEVCFFTIVLVYFIGRLGEVQLDAYRFVSLLGSVSFMFILGLATATTIRVSNNLGAGQFEASRQASFAAVTIAALVALVVLLVLLIAGGWIAAQFSEDAEIVSVVAQSLLLYGVLQLINANQVTAIAALRGFKDAIVPMCIAVVCYGGIGLPVGLIMGFGVGDFGGWGVIGFWFGAVVGIAVSTVLMFMRLRWVTKDAKRYFEMKAEQVVKLYQPGRG